MNTDKEIMDFAYQLGMFLYTLDSNLSPDELRHEVGTLISARLENPGQIFNTKYNRVQFMNRVSYAYLYKQNWPNEPFVRGEDLDDRIKYPLIPRDF